MSRNRSQSDLSDGEVQVRSVFLGIEVKDKTCVHILLARQAWWVMRNSQYEVINSQCRNEQRERRGGKASYMLSASARVQFGSHPQESVVAKPPPTVRTCFVCCVCPCRASAVYLPSPPMFLLSETCPCRQAYPWSTSISVQGQEEIMN